MTPMLSGYPEVTTEEVSEQWAKALTSWVDKHGGDGPSLWEWQGKCPTPAKVVEYLDFLMELRCDMAAKAAADEELEECCKAIRDKGWFADPSFRLAELRSERRPSPQYLALKALERLKVAHNLDPKAVEAIETALSFPGPLHDGGRN